MFWLSLIHGVSGRFKKWLLILGAALILFWFVFLDSHSLISRLQWHGEQSRLEEENARLKAEIEMLDERLSRRLTDEEIERIAREQYGMTRQGEVVYPLELEN